MLPKIFIRQCCLIFVILNFSNFSCPKTGNVLLVLPFNLLFWFNHVWLWTNTWASHNYDAFFMMHVKARVMDICMFRDFWRVGVLFPFFMKQNYKLAAGPCWIVSHSFFRSFDGDHRSFSYVKLIKYRLMFWIIIYP